MTKEPLFPLGKVYLTRGVAEVFSIVEINRLIERHQSGDCDSIPFHEFDYEYALRTNDEIFSTYGSPWDDHSVFIVTTEDRLETTVKLSHE